MAQLMSVKLSRFDASPWGFRLQGGKDFGAPLLIQKVNGGSLAEKAGLQAGDAVIKVNNVEVFNLRHKEAQDVIVRAGNNFEVTVQRGGGTWKPNVTPIGPSPTINSSSPAANIQPVTKTSLAARKQESKPIGTGHNLSAKPFGPQVNGSLSEPTVKSIVNKQYNTPVGMYSEESIAETLSAQAEVLAGGVLGVNFKKNEKNYNAANSEVFKMVQEIDSEPKDAEPAPPASSTFYSTASHAVGGTPRPITPLAQRLPTGSAPSPATAPSDTPKCSDCDRYIVGGKAPAGTISAALSAATAPIPRPVSGPTSAPAPRPIPVAPSSPQTIGPMPFHTPTNISAPKPFSVPTAPTTSPARPAPATSNKFAWPPHKEEDVPTSLLATATPLYIPPTPSHHPKSALSQSNQTQGEFLEQIHPVLDQQLPQIQQQIIPFEIQPQKSLPPETKQNLEEKFETYPVTALNQNISLSPFKRDLVKEQQMETHIDQQVISKEETSIQAKEIMKKISVCSQEVSLITKTDSSQLAVEKTQVQVSLDSDTVQRPPSPPPKQETPPSQQTSSLALTTETTNTNQELPSTNSELEERLSTQVSEEIVKEIVSPVIPIKEEAKVNPLPPSDEIQQPVELENKKIISHEQESIEISSVMQEVTTETVSEGAQTNELTTAAELQQPQASSISADATKEDSEQVSSQQSLQSSSENLGRNPSADSPIKYSNKGLSYKQLPVPSGGDFRPISIEQQTAECQEVSLYTSQESSVSNPGPNPFPKQILPQGPKFIPNTSRDSPAGNPGKNPGNPGGQHQDRSEACPSPMVSALTIAPDRPYCLIPSAIKPQAPQQSSVPTQPSAIKPQAPLPQQPSIPKIPSAIKTQAPLPQQPFIPTGASTVPSNLPRTPSKATNLGDETQLPFLPSSSQPISMLQALTIAPDRPYSPFTTASPLPNTVVQSEASAFTAVSPQTINTKPKMTTPQNTAAGNVSQSYIYQPLPTSDAKRAAMTPASPRPVSRKSLPVIGGFRPTVPTGDLRPPSPDNRWQTDSQKFESDSVQHTTIAQIGLPTTTQVTTVDQAGGQVVVQRTRRVEESSYHTHKEMQKTIQRTPGQKPIVSSSTQHLRQESNLSSTFKEQKTSSSFQQQQQIKQQQFQQKHSSTLGASKPTELPYYQQDIDKFLAQKAFSPIPTSHPVSSPIPAQQQPSNTGTQSKLPVAPAAFQHQKRQQEQQQQQQKQLYSLSEVHKPGVIPFYQQDIERYQRQRALSPAPHSQVQRALSPQILQQQPSSQPNTMPSAPKAQSISQSTTLPPVPEQPIPQTSVPKPLPVFQSGTLPSTFKQQPGSQVPSKSATLPKQTVSQPLSTLPAKQTSDFSLPFPNIPLPEGVSAESVMKGAKVSTKTPALPSQPQIKQEFPSIPQAFKPLPTTQPLPTSRPLPISGTPPTSQPLPTVQPLHTVKPLPTVQSTQTAPSIAPQPATTAFKPQSSQQPKQPPSVATQPSSVTKIPVPPSSSSIPNAGGSIGGGGGGVGGGPSGQKGSASFAGSSAPRRGRGVLNQQTPGGRIPLCGHCNNQIRGPFITALGRIWCPDHFVCVNGQCRRPLQDIGFVEEKGELYCEFCFEQYIAPSCDKCSKKIKGDCLNAIGKHFHPECFLCAYCGKLFGNNPFYLEDGLPYCEADWNELFTTKCFACGFPIEAGDRWVEALNNNYHSQCFNCTTCKKNLEGQNFYAKGGRPFCKAHAR